MKRIIALLSFFIIYANINLNAQELQEAAKSNLSEANKLKSEVTFTDQFVATGDWATITLYNESNTQAYVPMNTLPTHDAGDEDLSQGELAGTWALRCDTHDSGNNPYTLDLGNNQIIYYDDVYSREFLESADRNWRLVFIPDNAAYNDVEISVNIQIV